MSWTKIFPRMFLTAYALAALYAAIAHLFFSAGIAGNSSWGFAPGWQREIACFDALLASACVTALRKGREEFRRFLLCALSFLSLALGSNHLLAYLRTHLAFHLQWAILNASAVPVGLLCFRAGSK